jgi:hypothetical protein
MYNSKLMDEFQNLCAPLYNTWIYSKRLIVVESVPKRIQLRNEKCYDDVGTCSVIANLNSFTDAYIRKNHNPFSLDEDIITSNSFLNMLKNYALLQFKNDNNDLIPQLDDAPVHFAQTVCDCLNLNFPG